MSHNVETIAWTAEKPWHGLGTEVSSDMTPAQMMAAAGIDWTVSKRALSYNFKGKLAKAADFALVRDTDGAYLDTVGPDYVPVQNAKVAEFFSEYVKAGEAKMDVAGSLRGGRVIWFLAKLQESFKIGDKDRVEGNMLFVSPHTQGKAAFSVCTSVRVVCNNTLNLVSPMFDDDAPRGRGGRAAGSRGARASDLSARWTFRHVREFDDKVVAEAKAVMGIARSRVQMFAKAAKTLSELEVGQDAIQRLILEAFTKKVEYTEIAPTFAADAPKAVAFTMAALENAPGAKMAGATTGWGVLNAATYTVDHLMGKSPDRRLALAWLGRGNAVKQRVFTSLMQLAS